MVGYEPRCLLHGACCQMTLRTYHPPDTGIQFTSDGLDQNFNMSQLDVNMVLWVQRIPLPPNATWPSGKHGSNKHPAPPSLRTTANVLRAEYHAWTSWRGLNLICNSEDQWNYLASKVVAQHDIKSSHSQVFFFGKYNREVQCNIAAILGAFWFTHDMHNTSGCTRNNKTSPNFSHCESEDYEAAMFVQNKCTTAIVVVVIVNQKWPELMHNELPVTEKDGRRGDAPIHSLRYLMGDILGKGR